jgi:hypothetical protein
MLFVVTLKWQKNGRKINTYLDRQAVSLKIDTMVSTHWYPFTYIAPGFCRYPSCNNLNLFAIQCHEWHRLETIYEYVASLRVSHVSINRDVYG